MPTPALFINGVFKATLAEIEKTQTAHPGMVCYLQPYAKDKIKLLAGAYPTRQNPVTLYLSLTNSLPYISYSAKIVGWQNKQELAADKAALAALNKHIKDFQPSENDIYLTASNGKPCVNLISVVDVKRFETQVSVSCFIKLSDGKPLRKRTRAGGWSPVGQQHEWLGTVTEVVKDDLDAALRAEVQKSLNGSASARLERLATAQKMPEAIQVVSRAFRRDADVIAEVLIRAGGVCEACHSTAPFVRASDETPYLEVHHRKLLSAGGQDSVDNAIAACPNCHRKLHYGKNNGESET